MSVPVEDDHPPVGKLLREELLGPVKLQVHPDEVPPSLGLSVPPLGHQVAVTGALWPLDGDLEPGLYPGVVIAEAVEVENLRSRGHKGRWGRVRAFRAEQAGGYIFLYRLLQGLSAFCFEGRGCACAVFEKKETGCQKEFGPKENLPNRWGLQQGRHQALKTRVTVPPVNLPFFYYLLN